jgi:hypothetical protein
VLARATNSSARQTECRPGRGFGREPSSSPIPRLGVDNLAGRDRSIQKPHAKSERCRIHQLPPAPTGCRGAGWTTDWSRSANKPTGGRLGLRGRCGDTGSSPCGVFAANVTDPERLGRLARLRGDQAGRRIVAAVKGFLLDGPSAGQVVEAGDPPIRRTVVVPDANGFGEVAYRYYLESVDCDQATYRCAGEVESPPEVADLLIFPCPS